MAEDNKKPPADTPDKRGPQGTTPTPTPSAPARAATDIRAGTTGTDKLDKVEPDKVEKTDKSGTVGKTETIVKSEKPDTPERPAAASAPPAATPRAAERTATPPARSREDTPMARSTRAQANWGSMLTAGIVGGAVVALAAGSAWVTLFPGDGGDGAVGAKVAALEARVGELAARPAPAAVPADLAGRLGRLEAAATAASRQGGADPALTGRLTAAEAAVARLTEQLGRAEKRLDDAAKSGGVAAAAAPAAPGVQPAELEALATRVAGLERNLVALQQQVAQRANAPVSDRAVRLAVLASGLRTLVDRGAPYTAELAAAKQLVSDPQTFAPLEPFAASGVPSALVLGRELAAVVPAMLKAGELPARDDYLDRLQAEAEKLVRIRPVKDTAGDDLAAQIGRAEAKARQADLAGAVAELAKLPPAVRAPAEPWIKKAEARQAAVAAAQRVASGALGALATP